MLKFYLLQLTDNNNNNKNKLEQDHFNASINPLTVKLSLLSACKSSVLISNKSPLAATKKKKKELISILVKESRVFLN